MREHPCIQSGLSNWIPQSLLGIPSVCPPSLGSCTYRHALPSCVCIWFRFLGVWSWVPATDIDIGMVWLRILHSPQHALDPKNVCSSLTLINISNKPLMAACNVARGALKYFLKRATEGLHYVCCVWKLLFPLKISISNHMWNCLCWRN